MKTIEKLEKMWKELGDIPINNKEEIQDDFYDWQKNTDIYEIWSWFDEQHPDGVAKGLMDL
jgi:hypothetical protein